MPFPLRKFLLIATVLTAVVLVLWTRRSHFDATSNVGDIHDVDKINFAIPMLDDLVRSNPAANSYCVRYRIVPDPSLPREYLPRTIEFNRAARTLRWQREVWFEHYDNVTDAILHDVAGRKGGVRMLIKRGCPRTFPRR